MSCTTYSRLSITIGVLALIAWGTAAGQSPSPAAKETSAAPAAGSAEEDEFRSAALEKKNDLAGAASALRQGAMKRKQVGELLPGAEDLRRLGSIQLRQGELDESERSYRECLAIRLRLAPGSREEAAAWNGLGAVAYSHGDLREAERLYVRALEIEERVAPESVEAARTTGNLGLVEVYRGNLERAEGMFRRALSIQEKLDPEGIEVASPLNYLGLVAKDRGDFDSAEQYYRRAIAIFEKKNPGSLSVAGMLNNVGVLAKERGDYAAAEAAQRKALEIRRRLAPDGLDVAASLHNLGEIALLRKDLDNAEPLLREALAIKEKAAPHSLFVATTLLNLAEVHLRKPDLSRATDEAREALEIRNRLMAGSFEQAEALVVLAEVERASGEREKAADDYRRAIDALEAQRRKLGGTDIERAAFSGKSIGYYRDAVALLHELKRDEDAFALLERSRARELLALIARRDLQLDAHAPPDLLAERNRLDSDYDRVQQQMARIDPVARKDEADRLVARLFELRQKRSANDEKIWAASPKIRELESPHTMSLLESRETLDPGTILLSYSIGEKETLLFVVGSGKLTPLAVYSLGAGRDELRNEVGIFRNLILQERDDPHVRGAREEAGRRLFQRLVAPAASSIAAGKRILICPDGPLHLLPFGALSKGETAGERPIFLAEWRPLHVAISVSMAQELARRRKSAGASAATLAAFGDPRPNSSPRARGPEGAYRSVAERAQMLPAIPSSRQEVESVVSIFGDRAEKYVGRSATEERVGAVATRARFLHFACHAVLDSRFPLDSALVLAPPEVEHPGSDNGLLQAWEIYERLRTNADLVTLSACDTALGKESGGEGLVGLVRAFHFAGARSVLASLWSISDRSTPSLMAGFYRGVKSGLPMDEALRQAQVASIRKGGRPAAPYFWSAFELQGDWR